MSECLTILKKLIQLPSENPPGITRPVIEWIKSWAKENEIPTETYWYEEDKADVILSVGKSEKTIVICGHLDTVPIGDLKNWKYNPFSAVEENGYIWGRGSADMKGGVAASLSALKLLKNSVDMSKLKYKIVFLGTSDEEVDFKGAKIALENKIMDSADFLIVPEPTGLNIGIAEKGILWIIIRAFGKAAHGSTPEKGVNAIEELTKLFPKLHNNIPIDSHHILGQSTLNIGMIKGGKSTNVVPEQAEIHCDYRLVPPIKPAEYAKKIDTLIKEHSSPARFETEVKQAFSAVQSSLDNELINSFMETANKEYAIGVNYATDAAVLVTPPSIIPFVLFGPGDPKAIHQANERVLIKEVIEAESIILKFLRKINGLSGL